MKKDEYLLPPGQEICAGSAAEAFLLFRSLGIFVTDVPIPGIVRRRSEPAKSYYVWAVIQKNAFYVMSLFPDVEVPQCKDWEFSPFTIGEMIMHTRRCSYEITYDKYLGHCIRFIDLYWHERYPIGEGGFMGAPKARYMLCRLYVTEENSRLLTYCWIGYEAASRTTLFIKLFAEDWELLSNYSYTELGRKAVSIGERFETHGKHFVLKEDKDGFQFLEPVFHNPYMHIVYPERLNY